MHLLGPAGKILLTVTLSFFGIAFLSSLYSPPVYGQTANAWNIQRITTSNLLDFYYSTGGSTILELNPNGQSGIRSIVDLDNPSTYFLDPNGTSNVFKLGIGTTTPSALFEVGGDGASTTPYAELNGLRISGGDTSNTIYNGARDIHISRDTGGFITLMRTSSPTIGLTVDTTSGNVGIGTTTPGQKLDVNGIAQISENVSGRLRVNSYNTASFNFGIIDNASANGGLTLRSNDLDRLTIANGGNVGIGTTTPTQKLDVAGNINANGLTASSINVASLTVNPGAISLPYDCNWSGDPTTYAKIEDHCGHLYLGPASTYSDYMIFRYGSDDRIYFRLNGNVDTNRPSFRTNGAYLVINPGINDKNLYLNWDTGGNVQINGNLYSSIMYDRDNAGYYVDPNNTSQVVNLYRNGGFNGPEYDVNNAGYYVDPHGTSQFLNLLRNAGFNGAEYDYNNTGYYVDPNGTSNMNADYRYWGYNGREYDGNNGAYYVDPNGDTQLNALYANNYYLPWLGWLNNFLNQSVAVDSSPNFGNPSVNNIWFEPWGNWISAFLNPPSDQRLKKNIQNMTDETAKKLDQLKPVSFEWIDKSPETGFEQEKGTKYGFIAQDIEKIFPDMVMTDGNGYKSIHYEQITSLLVKSFQDLKQKNLDLEEQNTKLKSRLDSIEAEINQLKQSAQ